MTPDPDRNSVEQRLKYLEEYHSITQHLIGIARLHMTPEQLEKIASYSRELDILWIRRMRQFGVSDEDLIGFFRHDPADVAASHKDA